MKKLMCFLAVILLFVLQGETFSLNIRRGKVRNCEKTRWEAQRLRAGKPGFSAALDFSIRQDTTPFNRLRTDITPFSGKFVKRNFVITLREGDKSVDLRPLEAPSGVELEKGKKNILEYIIPERSRKFSRLRLYFNRKKGDTSPLDFKLGKLELYYTYTPRSYNDFDYKVKTEDVILLVDSERGFTAKEALFRPFGKRSSNRPAPIARLFADQVTGSGRAAKNTVPVELLEETGTARNAQLRFGIPFAAREVFSLQNLRLTDEKGREIPAQFAVQSRYADNSLRHVFVTAFYPLKAREKRLLYLEYGNKVAARSVEGLRYTFDGKELAVDAGRLKARVSRQKFDHLADMTVDGRSPGKFLPAEITLADGKKFTIAPPERFEIIEAGPLRLTLRASGKYTGAAGAYTVRLTFLYNRPQIELAFTHINSETDREFTDIRSLYLHFRPAGKGRPGTVFQKTENEYLLNGRERKGFHSGAFAVADQCGIALANWHQRYPKSMTIQADSCAIGLLPELPEKDFYSHLPWKLKYLFANGDYRLKWGTSFTERLIFNFDDTLPEVLEAEVDKPVIAVLPAARYRETGLIPDDPGTVPVDAGITDAFNRYIARQKNEREFGFLNWGDSFGERGHSWTNNEYDPAQSIAETFLRTGNRDMLRYVLVTARHQADVDTCYAYPDPYFIGSNVQHGVGHSGIDLRWSGLYNRYTAASGGHSWTRGRLYAWLLCGDAVVMDSALLFGDHAAFAVIPNYKTIIGEPPREIGWMLRALVPLYEITRDPAYLAAMKQAAALAVRECAFDKGAWPRPIRRIRKAYGITDKGNVTYQAALMLKGLCDYYGLTGDPAVKRVIISTARWIIKAFAPSESAGFHYDLSADGKVLNWPYNGVNALIAPPLAEAAVIADDPEIFAVAAQAMAKVLLNEHPVSHKHFALELTFVADYLKAAAAWNRKHGLVSDYSQESLARVFFGKTPQTLRIRGNSSWRLVSLVPDARITLTRWIRSGRPAGMVRAVLRDDRGKILADKTLPAGILHQKLALQLPGKKGRTFKLDITDSNSGDWSLSADSPVRSFVAMKPDGLSISHIGLRRIWLPIPAGVRPVIRYAGSHQGEWSICIRDGKKVYRAKGYAPDVSVARLRKDAAVFTLPVMKKPRTAELLCHAVSDGRLLIENVPEITVCKE